MRLRLVKVTIMPTFVLDDDNTLTEYVAEPVAVTATDWPTYATDVFPGEVASLEAQITAAAPATPLTRDAAGDCEGDHIVPPAG